MVGISDFNKNPVVSLDLDFDLGFVKMMITIQLAQLTPDPSTNQIAKLSPSFAEPGPAQPQLVCLFRGSNYFQLFFVLSYIFVH